MQYSQVNVSSNQSSILFKQSQPYHDQSSSNTVNEQDQSIQQQRSIFDPQEFSRCLMYVVKCATLQKGRIQEVSKIMEMRLDYLKNDISSVKLCPNSQSYSVIKDQLFDQSYTSMFLSNFLFQVQQTQSRFLSQQKQFKQLKATIQKLQKQMENMKKKIAELESSRQQANNKYITYKKYAHELKSKLDTHVNQLNSSIDEIPLNKPSTNIEESK